MRSEAPARAGRREWIGLGVLALPCLLYSMDLTVLNLAVPSLSADLKPGSTELLWIIDIYGFMVAGSLITMGTLGDRIGRRRLLLFGAAAFGVASVLAAFSTSPRMLIAARAVLGLAGATLAPSTLSLIRNMFHDPGQRSIAIAVWISSYSAGAVIGPPLGGILLQSFWWGSVFLVSVPMMVLVLALAPVLLPEFRAPDAGRPDAWSAILSVTAVLLVIYGLKQIAAYGPGWVAALSILAGSAVGFVFVRRQRKLSDPMIDLTLFRTPAFSASLVTYMFATFAVFGPYVFIAQYLQLVLGLSPLQAGLWSTPHAGAFVVGSMLSPLLARRIRPAPLMAAGLVVATAGFLLLMLVGRFGLPVIVASAVIYSLGLSPVFTLANDIILGAAPPERAGAASAISETSSEFGGALGIAALGSLGTAIYRSAMVGIADLDGVPAAAAETARDTLGGAVLVAAQLPDQGTALLATARTAFTDGLQAMALTSALIMVGLAALVMALRRDLGATTDRQPPPDRAPDAAAVPTA
ncbi:MAG TPA: MFS transporter [Candidatus Polarisedimenticolia bacterium]|nr:MFS transporter [Candidatus Polarisedimenticolia bacterium]